MREHRIIFIVVSVLMYFCSFQAWYWSYEPYPGWTPEWWQFESAAEIGAILTVPAMIVGSLADNLSHPWLREAMRYIVLLALFLSQRLPGLFLAILVKYTASKPEDA